MYGCACLEVEGDRDQPDMSDAGHAVRRRLEADGDRCLLIFDGAEDPEALRPFVPIGGAARVLITSTRPAGASWLAGVPVDVFTPEEARAFLAERAERADDAAAAAVAAELGHLPLALALAAAVAVGQQAGYQGCLERLRALPAGEPLAQGESQAPPLGIVQPVLLSLEAVRTADGTGVCTRLMEIMAVLSTAGVCRDLLHDAGRRRVAATDVDRAIAELTGRSLLTVSLDGQTIVMHPLVADVIRVGLAQRGELTAACRAAASVLVARAQAVNVSRDRPAVRDICQQVTALLASMTGSAGENGQASVGDLLRIRFLYMYHLI